MLFSFTVVKDILQLWHINCAKNPNLLIYVVYCSSTLFCSTTVIYGRFFYLFPPYHGQINLNSPTALFFFLFSLLGLESWVKIWADLDLHLFSSLFLTCGNQYVSTLRAYIPLWSMYVSLLDLADKHTLIFVLFSAQENNPSPLRDLQFWLQTFRGNKCSVLYSDQQRRREPNKKENSIYF